MEVVHPENCTRDRFSFAMGNSSQRHDPPVLGTTVARLVNGWDADKQLKAEGWTRFVCFSDTHGRHARISPEHIPEADVLLHAGDFSDRGELEQVRSFAQWLKDYPAKEKVVIAGNHDLSFHEAYCLAKMKKTSMCAEAKAALAGSCIYLEDELVEVLGYKIYGSPWQPEFCDWAFNLPRGEALAKVWAKIPDTVDILMTHGPAQGILDHCNSGLHAGCEDLLTAIKQREIPVHVSGHIHEGYGCTEVGKTLFINASTCTFSYRPTNAPIVFDLPPPELLRGQSLAEPETRGLVEGYIEKPHA
ncbi:unnamed protein product [Effrenium voratum]|uniref:Calcineurin-like phosphoesterase domain-containing protein n=1 Tax=Effrenium voratum TaxID=2562239 RepID=A0AA36NIG5_9DINO|nr:unnamed protein product [Effrenium voratum]